MNDFALAVVRWLVCPCVVLVPFAIGLGLTAWLGVAWGLILCVIVGALIMKVAPAGMGEAFATLVLLIALAAGFACGVLWRVGSFFWTLAS